MCIFCDMSDVEVTDEDRSVVDSMLDMASWLGNREDIYKFWVALKKGLTTDQARSYLSVDIQFLMTQMSLAWNVAYDLGKRATRPMLPAIYEKASAASAVFFDQWSASLTESQVEILNNQTPKESDFSVLLMRDFYEAGVREGEARARAGKDDHVNG